MECYSKCLDLIAKLPGDKEKHTRIFSEYSQHYTSYLNSLFDYRPFNLNTWELISIGFTVSVSLVATISLPDDNQIVDVFGRWGTFGLFTSLHVLPLLFNSCAYLKENVGAIFCCNLPCSYRRGIQNQVSEDRMSALKKLAHLSGALMVSLNAYNPKSSGISEKETLDLLLSRTKMAVTDYNREHWAMLSQLFDLQDKFY